jgi:hypothetical protein
MMPSAPIRNRTDTCHSGRRSHGSTLACAGPPDWPVVAPQILLTSPPSARSRQRARQSFDPKPPHRQARISFTNTHAGAKSP